MDFFGPLLKDLPSWFLWPLGCVVALLLGWPKFRDVGTDILPSLRVYQREKRKLELLKLLYEIEVLRKSNSLDDLTNNLPEAFQSKTINEKTNSKIVLKLGRIQTFCYGTLGSIVISTLFTVLFIVYKEQMIDDFSVGILIGYSLRYFILGVIGGLLVLFLRPATRLGAIAQGAGVTIVLIAIASVAFEVFGER